MNYSLFWGDALTNRIRWRRLWRSFSRCGGFVCLNARGVIRAAFTVTYAKVKAECHICSVTAPTAMGQVGCVRRMASGGISDYQIARLAKCAELSVNN